MTMIINSVFPVFTLIALGHILGRRGFFPPQFFAGSDRLVYFVFFPVLLFWKIGGRGPGEAMNWPLILAVLAVLVAAWILSLIYVRVTRTPDSKVGAFSQCTYRFNTYIGLPVILSALGDDGVRTFGVLISVVIPALNIMAVATLIWFAQKSYSFEEKVRLFFREALLNPLIIGCLAGLVYGSFHQPLPTFFNNTFQLLSVAALPLALLSIGHSLTLTKLKGYFNLTVVCCVIKHFFVPVSGYFVLTVLGIDGVPFRTAMLFFGLPTSVSAFILSSQLGSDPDLASACIVGSTLVSFFSLSAALVV